MHYTPLLVDVSNKTFEEYIQSLSKSSKKNYHSVIKKNSDLEYLKINFDIRLVRRFMQLWELQEVSTGSITLGFTIQYLEYLNKKGKLICFVARKKNEKENIISLHFVENHSGYVECHAPMYDKNRFIERSVAKYMWYNLFKYTIENPKIKWVDLGGGNNGSWKNLLYRHILGKTKSYKWYYVPAEIKKNPDQEKPYVIGIKLLPYKKYLVEENKENYLLYKLKKKILILLYYNMGNWIKKLYGFFEKRCLNIF